MVLTDDDFATIEAAVEEGRGVFDNLTKFITWTLPTNIGEGLVILVAIVFGTALPILPDPDPVDQHDHGGRAGTDARLRTQGSRDHDRGPPARPDQPLLTGALMVRILLVSTSARRRRLVVVRVGAGHMAPAWPRPGRRR